MNRSATGSAKRSVPCLNSNNCIEPDQTGENRQLPSSQYSGFKPENELNEFSTSYRKSTAALEMNVKAFIEAFGLDKVGFLTLTFADDVTDPKEAQRRFHSLRTNFLKRHFPEYVCVYERTKKGRIHFHLLVNTRLNIRRGLNFRQIAAGNYKTANPYLRHLWTLLRENVGKYGFGRTELLPVKTNSKGLSRYVSKYIAKHINSRLTESEIADILRRMLESNQTTHEELMRQLSMMGNVVSESTINITYNQTTAKSAPYTPQGSRQAQQTEATVHKDGSITTNVIPRPDLKPDSSQAPTREQVVPNTPGENVPQNPNGQNQNPSTSEQNQQRQEFCKQNPTSAYCQDLGNTDYEDLSIPTNAIDMTLRPLDIFSTDGICPAPLSFEFGPLGKFEISYDFLCKVARLIRPIAILGTMISCSFTAFAAIKEL